jgi:predicted metal-dependent peptidase
MEEQNSIEQNDFTESPAEALNMALQWLCSVRGGNNFFGRLLNGCTHVVNYNLPYGSCAGVGLNAEGYYQLIYSPHRFKEFSPPLRVLILVHEAAHLALRHLERMLRTRLAIHDDKKLQRLHPIMNVAADMAANDIAIRPLIVDTTNHFDSCQSVFIWPEDRNYPPGQSYEEYFVLLLKDLKQHGFDPNFDPEKDLQEKLDQMSAQDSDSSGNTPSTSGPTVIQRGNRPGDALDKSYPDWFKDLLNRDSYTAVIWDPEYSQMTDAEIESNIENARRDAKRLVREAVEQTTKSRGTIPAGLKGLIADLLGEPTIPWQEIFKGMLRSAITAKLDESTAYPNLAWVNCEDIEPYPGMQKNFTFNILVGVDTSGSVSTEEFREFLREILGITDVEAGINAYMVMFDAALQKEEILTDEVINSARASGYSRCGYGGTDFTPFLKYVNHQDEDSDWLNDAERAKTPPSYPIDLAVLFTDGFAPVGNPGPIPEYLPSCPLIWALTPSGKDDDYMQPRIVRIGEK